MEDIRVKQVKESYTCVEDIEKLLEQITKKESGTVYWDTRGMLKNIEKVSSQIVMVQNLYGKTKGRRIIHMVMSFPKNEKDFFAIRIIADGIADYLGEEFQLLYSIHAETANIHIHFVISTVSFVNGKKWNIGLWEFHKLINKTAEIVTESLLLPEEIIDIYKMKHCQHNV